MKRMKVLFGNRRMMVLLTLAILVLTATALVASSASFTATSANPGNMFTSGSLGISNTQSGAILTALNMKPGEYIEGSATIGNTGSIPGTFKLAGVMDTARADYSTAFAGYLNLKVYEDGGSTPIYDDTLSGFTSLNLTSGTPWAGGATHAYLFRVTFPNGDAGAENTMMGKSATIDFTWSAAQ
jgi:hypothetical protein